VNRIECAQAASISIAAIAGATLILAAPGAHADQVSLSKARATLISSGWDPRETFGALADGRRWNRIATAGALYEAGYIEVQGCTGTSPEFCIFNYARLGKCMTLRTHGEPGSLDPEVVWRDQECPPKAITAPPTGMPAAR
jgi:hypothetical protein